MDLNVKGKVAIVTGGAAGIGEAICLKLAEEGVKVAVNYFRTKADDLIKKIEDAGGTAVAIQCDISKEEDAIRLFEETEKVFGQNVEILVNNAAYLPSGWISDYTVDEWEHTFKVNVTAAFVTCREFIKRLDAVDKTGKIVNIISQAAFLASTSGHMPYDSSKGAVLSMTRAIARETAERGYNANCVAPGMVMTKMVAEVWEQKKDKYLSKIPMKRIAEPEEIANATVFLASDMSSYMTGTCLDLTGGLMMH